MITNETTQTAVQGGMAAVAVSVLQAAAVRMIPYFLPAIPLIILDCVYGTRAAKYRGEKVTASKLIRMTTGKVFSYLCWLILAPSLAIAFDKQWIEWFVLGLVFCNELLSVVGNYLETKDMQISLVGLFRWLFRVGANKVGAEVTSEDAETIIQPKPKQPRKANGQFAKKCGIDIEVIENEETV